MIRKLVKPALFSLAVLTYAAPAMADYEAGELAAKSGNASEAFRQWGLSARLGEARSQKALGLMLRDGQGVLQDYVSAHMWLNLAAAQGDKEAAKERDALSRRMGTEQVAEAQRRAASFQPGLSRDDIRPLDQTTVAAAPQEAVTKASEPLPAKTDGKADVAPPAPSPLAGLWLDRRNGYVISIEPAASGGFVMKEALIDGTYNYPGDVIGEFKPDPLGGGYAGRHLRGGKRTGDASWSADGAMQVALAGTGDLLVKYTDSTYDGARTYQKID